jgi:hypothetical protein
MLFLTLDFYAAVEGKEVIKRDILLKYHLCMTYLIITARILDQM